MRKILLVSCILLANMAAPLALLEAGEKTRPNRARSCISLIDDGGVVAYCNRTADAIASALLADPTLAEQIHIRIRISPETGREVCRRICFGGSGSVCAERCEKG